ncbi:DEAD/DEAH box helicase [Iamia majanohamensis]|uniref:DEAD/DEAH box helicase n=1 Tax=Iamia majanohamensis TaxID=467976 RepID=A0AAE9YAB5_9ACTN|nr:DEAD/DEAH box helicase [Iamia majanohamensis]WCO65327.1 DEAD/DEAH box helicase [Iamia majanohamensis]
MHDVTPAFEAAVWAAVEGRASEEQQALLEAAPGEHRRLVERLIDDTDDALERARTLKGHERTLVVADFESDLALLESTLDLMTRVETSVAAGLVADPPGEVRLQASWSNGDVVLWAGGPGMPPAGNAELSDRIQATGAPANGWAVHPGVRLPGGVHAEAVSIPLADSLGWMVAVGGGLGGEGLGLSVTWLGRVAVAAVRLVAQGRIVPNLRSEGRTEGSTMELNVRWVPALVDEAEVEALAQAMPGPVVALGNAEAKTVTRNVLAAAVDAIVSQAARFLELEAPPPSTRNAVDVAEAVITRLDGSTFTAPVSAGAEVSKRLQRWTKAVTNANRPTLVVQLDPPDKGDAWFLSVLGVGAEGGLLPVEVALVDGKDTKALGDELARLERVFPALLRAGALRRGQVYLSQDEAWELMTVTGRTLETAGFDVRVPPLSRRKPSAGLKLWTEPTGDSVVGAHQLSNVRWTALFDDVELTAAEVARLAAEARPLVRSHGRWVELDRADLKEAAVALAERADTTQLTGAEILRHSVGLEGTPLAGGLQVAGEGWATDLLTKAAEVSTEPVTSPPGFEGELRSYQAEALAWLGYLDATELGGCLALDMGLGKTPTVLAHLRRTQGDGPALVVVPPAVAGNWANEAARFTPDLRVVVHHGQNRAPADRLAEAFDGVDVVITTYGTAVRDVDALEQLTWRRVVLDEAQAIKNHTNETAQQLRRIPARTRVALTGTPVENGLGDLWSILDFTNPGLVGPRATFIAQLSGEGEAALRALNGILVFRRTKSEPEVAAELPDRIDELDHCAMTPEQIGLYQAVLDGLMAEPEPGATPEQAQILAAITALKQICNHPENYEDTGGPLEGRSGKLARLEEILEGVFAYGEKALVFTHFASWGVRLAEHLTHTTGTPVACYHGGLARGARDKIVEQFQEREGPGVLVLSLKAGGTGLNLTAASHVVLYDRWWNPAVEDQARDRAWRIGQERTVVSHRLVCPGTVDERVEEVVAGKRHIADMVLPKSSSLSDLDAGQLQVALGLNTDAVLTEEVVT